MMVSGRVRLTEGMSLPVSRSSAVMWLLPPVCSEMRREWSSRHASQAGVAGGGGGAVGGDIFGFTAGCGDEVDVAAGGTLVGHEAADEGDLFAVGGEAGDG